MRSVFAYNVWRLQVHMASSYKYTPLSPDTDQIRLLKLLPAIEQNEELVITLQSSTTKAAARHYEALSYVWGPADNPETISVVSSSTTGARDDVSYSAFDAASLPVTRNLAVALRHLRWQESARTLWIDAICIDQRNMAERSEQVCKMAQIYSLATRVVVWLGPTSPDSDLAMRLVGHLGQMVHISRQASSSKYSYISTSKGQAEPHWADAYQPLPYEEAELCALENLFCRPWFERLWVVQEVVTSTDAVVVCGGQETTWESFMVAARCLLGKTPNARKSDEFRSRIRHIYRTFDTGTNNSLLSLVRQMRGLKCADDKDRIYALLSLAKDGGNIKPDYSLSTIQVYRELAALSISRHDVDFLDDCHLGSRRLAGPSWIPDWAVKKMTTSIYPFNVCMFAKQSVFERQAEGCIRVSAVRVGSVVHVDVLSIPPSEPHMAFSEIFRVAPTGIDSLKYKTGCSLMEAFLGTLICSDLRPQVPQTEYNLILDEGMHGLRAALRCGNGADFELTQDSRSYLRLASRYAKNRALVRTDQGYIGLAPSDVKEGDIILAILSCMSFTVVRPAPGNEGRYNVVGESFLYGLTDGEAVLGPLPEHVYAEHHLHPELDEYYDAYLDTKTGTVSWIDPRLEALGISVETHANGLPCAVSVEDLEKAGIRLSQVELV